MKRCFPLMFTLLLAMCSSPGTQPDPSGAPSFPDPGPAGTVAAPFAPGLVSTGMFTRDMAITADGSEMYFSVSIGNYTHATILCSKKADGRWTTPEIVSFSGGPGIMDLEPALSPDDSKLFFMSTRPLGDNQEGNQDIWVVERGPDGWGDARNLGAPVNSEGGEFFPSLTHEGTLYFTRAEKGSQLNRIFRSRVVNGSYSDPELLPEQVNCGSNRFNAYISPDEDFLIVPAVGMEDAFDAVDYYITFRDAEDRWSEPQNMGAAVNKGNARGWSPYRSPDGATFFFMSNKADSLTAMEWNYAHLKALHNSPGNGNPCTWYMDAGFIDTLRSSASWADN